MSQRYSLPVSSCWAYPYDEEPFMSKSVNVFVGVNNNLKEIPLEIPDGTPKPWDGKDELSIIGGHTARIDGEQKTTGKAKYTFDIQRPGMLHAVFLRSHFPSGIIKSIDTSKAENAPGVKAVLLIQKELPLSIRFAGQEICAIAAGSLQQAQHAAELIKIDFEARPFVLQTDKAKAANAHVVFESAVKERRTEGDAPGGSGAIAQQGNVRGPKTSGTKAAADSIFNSGVTTIEGTFQTQVQTHSAMETHGVVAEWTGDQLTVWASTQGTFSVQNELAQVFEIPKTSVRVLTEHMGGGFGAKFGAGIYGVMAARLAKTCGAPVKLMLDRKSEHLAVGNRPDSIQKLKLGADKKGTIRAISLVSHGTAGVGTGAGTSGPVKNIYSGADAIYTEEYDVFINAGPGAAFRAPGHPQGTFALEQIVDEMAYQLRIDPLEFRRMNTRHDEVRQAQYDIGLQRSGWNQRPPVANDRGPIKRGLGMANSVWYYITGFGFQANLTVTSDGAVELTNGVQDIGGGIRTAIAMVIAEELGIPVEGIKVVIGDTQYGLAPGSGGSQTTAGITPAIRNAAYSAKLKMFDIAAPLLNSTPVELSAADGKIFVTDDQTKSLTWKQVASKINGDKFTVTGERLKDFRPAARFLAGMQFADVEVDTETGVIQVKKVVAVHDCGRPMNRLALESQINGGIIQGISYALFEDRILDRQTGIMVNPNLEQYKIAGSMDVPEIDITVIDVNHAQSSTGAMGIGEPATIPTAAAIANAFFHATGKRIRKLPMTSRTVLEALNS